MKLKTGKDEVVYLLTKVVLKYERETGKDIKRNTNRKNYEDLARMLSEISNRLPDTSETLLHSHYPPDENNTGALYPFRKYDITGGQIKDAINGIVSNPRQFLVDACYIYLYGEGRVGFAQKPVDEGLLEESAAVKRQASNISVADSEKPLIIKKTNSYLLVIILLTVILLIISFFWAKQISQKKRLIRDLSILPYQPTKAEIDSLEGIWLCYTGSPQARTYDAGRFHKIVSNIMDVKYINGYFKFTRYGSNFDHAGYMQFEAPWLVSIHSHVVNKRDSIESPKLSLMRLDEAKSYINVISASWNFDQGKKNRIIGIRELFMKQGKGGRIEEIINTPQNAACSCKIIRWFPRNDKVRLFYLKNELLDTIGDQRLKKTLDEKSILLSQPGDSTLFMIKSLSKPK
ncbi:hypothetical protein [Mucilaginibacter celer]|uniref:Uncharacterized protein n=1 Tax=Mucilaginibacter celer TaxID=2305508 RepID=A0A494VWI1_9SPHI|nr:hypothetical protein [Mucilaginibacter celer]AYL95833.1 hypothetical protein HYN43_011275 [Mucilaginibacter celer]